MTAFVPISPAAARKLLQGVADVDEAIVLSDFVAAGPIKAYARVIETLAADGGCKEVLDGRIPRPLWKRIVAEGKVNQIMASGSVKLDGDGLVGGRPAVSITGVRFNEGNVRDVATQHGAIAIPSPPKVTKAARQPAAAPLPPIAADAPTLIEAVPAAKVRAGLSPDAIAVSVNDAIDILGLGRTTINKLIGRGELPVKRTGGRTLVLADGIRDYLAR